MPLNAEHEKIPQDIIEAHEILLKLEMMRQNKEPGATHDVIETGVSYMFSLYREWVNDKGLWYTAQNQEENKTQYINRVYRMIENHYDELAAKIVITTNILRAYNDELNLYDTLPFGAPQNKKAAVLKKLDDLRELWSRYWREGYVVNWTYNQMLTMLETGQYVEAAADHRDDTQQAG